MKNLDIDKEKSKRVNFTINLEQSNKFIDLKKDFNCSKKSKIIRHLIDNLYNNIDHNKNFINKYVEQVKMKDLEQWRKQRKEPGKYKKVKLYVSLYKREMKIVESLTKELNLLSKSQLMRVLIDSQFELEEVK